MPTQPTPRPARVLLSTWMEGIEIIEGLERFIANGNQRDFEGGWPERLEQAADAMRRKIEKLAKHG